MDTPEVAKGAAMYQRLSAGKNKTTTTLNFACFFLKEKSNKNDNKQNININYNSFKVKMFMRKWQDMCVAGKEIYLSKETCLSILKHTILFFFSIIVYKK